MNHKDPIGSALAKVLNESQMSDVQVAAAVGVSESTVGRWRKGDFKPRIERYMALRRLLPEFAVLVDSLDAGEAA